MNNVAKVRVKRVELKVLFDIWEDELEVDEVPGVVSAAVEKMGYGLNDIEVVEVTEVDMEV